MGILLQYLPIRYWLNTAEVGDVYCLEFYQTINLDPVNEFSTKWQLHNSAKEEKDLKLKWNLYNLIIESKSVTHKSQMLNWKYPWCKYIYILDLQMTYLEHKV